MNKDKEVSNINFDLEERLSQNEQQRASDFRSEHESGIDVEYRQIRLEKVILIASYSNAKTTLKEVEYSLDELERLSQTAGAKVESRLTQQRPMPDVSTYFGKGKIEELKALIVEKDVDTVIVDETLLPSQRRALEDRLQTKVVDRTALILDIFAKHAKTKAGRAQVELAQLEYLLPRLRGWGNMMSRQGGGQTSGGAGIGSRGPGETQLEIDRRRINQKISLLKKRIIKIKSERQQSNQTRKSSPTPAVVIVGYTNAGKSSLLNAMTNSAILVQNALFATLDTTTRQLNKPKFTLTDTVGFIQNLPTTLVEAFHSTLEEANDADILLHVVDASAPNPQKQIDAVNHVLNKIRAIDNDGKIILKEYENEILVFNKIDLIDKNILDGLQRKYSDAIFVSVKDKLNIDAIVAKIESLIEKHSRYKKIDLTIPYTHHKIIGEIYKIGDIKLNEPKESGTHIVALVPFSYQIPIINS